MDHNSQNHDLWKVFMPISFATALGNHEAALKLRAQRAEMLANNLANADTPNFKARDMNFKVALQQQTNHLASSQRLSMNVTDDGHHLGKTLPAFDDTMGYRVPQQPSIDGNTVEEHVEHGEYMKNALAFQASFTFLNGRFKGLMSAIRGE